MSGRDVTARGVEGRSPDRDRANNNGSSGFLPIQTNAFDRVFIAVVIFVAINLLWMRFLEPLGWSLYIASAVSVVLGWFIVRHG